MNTPQKRLAIFLGAALFSALALGVVMWRSSVQVPFLTQKKSYNFDLEELKSSENIVPFLVLGSGPASLSAALYGARTKIRTVVLQGSQPGGQLTGTSYIENWPGIRKIRGAEVVKDHENQAARFGAVMVSDSASSVDLSSWPYTVTTEEGKVLRAFSLFIGTGATPRYLGIPGEQTYWGRGVTTCAICDAPYHKDDVVVVVGGGDSAVEEALELSSYAREVRMLIRSDVMRASPSMIERLDQCDNIKVVFNTALTQINGTDGKVSSVDIINSKTKEKEHWDDVKGVFLAIGHLPNTKLFKGQLDTIEGGYIKLKGRSQQTSMPGVFAAGDVSDPRYKQAGVAAGDGIKAGLDAVWWLSEIGYNGNIADQLEPYFFEPQLNTRITIEHVNSVMEFKEMVERAGEKILILDFYTKFCPSCMNMMPIVEWVGAKLAAQVIFVKVDASIAFDLVKKFEVPKVPSFLVTKHGKVIGRSGQVMDRAEMLAFAKKYAG